MVMGQHLQVCISFSLKTKVTHSSLQAPQLQMQVQQSPFGPVLGAVPRFR